MTLKENNTSFCFIPFSHSLYEASHFFAGIVRVWNKEQLKSRPVHHLNVTVSDGVFSARASLHVTVTPVNDHAPQFQHMEYRFSVQENLPSGTPFGRVEALDEDRGRYGQLKYRLLAETDNALFSINKNSGEKLIITMQRNLPT